MTFDRNIRKFHLWGGMALSWILSAAVLSVLMCLFGASSDIYYPNMFGTLLKYAGDSALILSPYWLSGRKWRASIVIPVWAYGIWSIVNLAYFRFRGDLLPSSALVMTSNVDGDVLKYGVALLRLSDSLFILLPLLLTGVLAWLRPWKSPTLDRMPRMVLLGCSALMFIAGQCSYLKSHLSWSQEKNETGFADAVKEHYLGVYNATQQGIYRNDGAVAYAMLYIRDTAALARHKIDLTDGQMREIKGFLEAYTQKSPSESMPDSVNLVYVIVESLNSEVVDMEVGGRKVMPVLDSLSRSDGTVYFSNVVPQIKDASSSDGHLILLTGLLPLRKNPYSMLYGDVNTFPSIADRFGRHHKYLLLADDGRIWNERLTLENFRLGKALTVDEMHYDKSRFGQDGAMMMHAADMLDTIRKPFLMTMMTMSMHMPFDEPAWETPPFISKSPGLSQSQKRYLTVCNGMDSALGRFIDALPSNTVVVVASDHTQNMALLKVDSPRAVFMAVNTGMTLRSDRTVGQVNLYPTLLQILGLKGGWRGLARSAVAPMVKGTLDAYGNAYGRISQQEADTLRKAFDTSDLIIRGDYFRNQPDGSR